MRLSMLRGLALGCLGILAMAFLAIAPASAATEPIGLATISVSHQAPDIILDIAPAAILAERVQMEAPSVRSSIDLGVIRPVYELLHRTNGNSLPRHPLRC